ncbi:MAG: ABC transporter ATP-binding protein [Propionibacteriaceae bacterium]|nr:ABC transporter ATP-binding protein [Propionibacteriaceae bacterium]
MTEKNSPATKPTVDSPPSQPPQEEPARDVQKPGIIAQNLKRSFGTVRAVDGVSFEAPAGGVTALIGPNGSGKTTLMLILAGLLQPDSGVAEVCGWNVVKDNYQARRRVGWMPDSFGTWDALTCTEILKIFGMAYGMKKMEAVDRGEELLEQLYLRDYVDRPARVLSRGQKQRLGLARALIHDPEVLLLDEPASGLDPRSRIEFRDIIHDLAGQGKTILVSSHVLSELDEYTDHAVFLSRGRTVNAEPADFAGTARGWRIAALDPVALQTFLTKADIPYQSAPGASGEFVISLGSIESAAQVMQAAIRANVPLHTLAPMAGRLEETYLQLNEERR